MKQRRTPIYRALNRPDLFMGGERLAVLSLLLASVGLVASSRNVVSTVVGSVLWFGGMYVLRRLAKFDPMFIRIYYSQLRFRAYHPPRSTPWRVD